MDNNNLWQQIWHAILTKHRNKFIGSMLGLTISLLVIYFGILRAGFIIICIGLGYFFGATMDKSGRTLEEFIDRFLASLDR